VKQGESAFSVVAPGQKGSSLSCLAFVSLPPSRRSPPARSRGLTWLLLRMKTLWLATFPSRNGARRSICRRPELLIDWAEHLSREGEARVMLPRRDRLSFRLLLLRSLSRRRESCFPAKERGHRDVRVRPPRPDAGPESERVRACEASTSEDQLHNRPLALERARALAPHKQVSASFVEVPHAREQADLLAPRRQVIPLRHRSPASLPRRRFSERRMAARRLLAT